MALDGVGLTEHSPSDVVEVVEVLADAGLLCVPGREVSCSGAHLLVFSEDLELLKKLPRLVSPDDARLGRGDVACIWAHPAAAAGSGAYPAFVPHSEGVGGLVHAIEILNGRHLAFPETIQAALRLAAELNLATTGGSDAHAPPDLGRCLTEIQTDPNEGAAGVIGAIRNGAVRPFLNEAWARLRRYDYREDLKGFVG